MNNRCHTYDRRSFDLFIYMAALIPAIVAGVVASAQVRPKATIDAVLDANGVHPGDAARVAVRVNLPDGVHVQSDAPRDPLLVGTDVTAQAPPGVTVADTAYPPATDFAQAGQPVPLAVFEQRFVVGLKLAVAPDAAPGDVVVPIRVRYQACNATTCFAPAREQVSVTLRVVSADVRPVAQHHDLFAALRFKH
jgi:hypothetical protein